MSAASTDAVVLAAGRGARVGTELAKQYHVLGDHTVLARAIDAFLDHPAVRRVTVAVGADDAADFRAAVGSRADRVRVVIGGASRQASVRAALEAMEDDPPCRVLIHDSARPFVSRALIDKVAGALGEATAVVPVIAVADTLKRVAEGRVVGTLEREGLAQAQTPQGFHFAALLAAHRMAPPTMTDDAGVMEAASHHVAVVPGESGNFKITTPDDLTLAARAVGGPAPWPAVGQGFDVHRLEPGGPLVLGGLTLEAPFHLSGHSDADVALHALTDALFGAVADGDIGAHFPPSDPAWRGVSSDRFLAFAADRVRASGAIAHLDLTIICERPKIGPVREAMRARIADIAGVPPARVSVKATTTERLGFTGRGEGIAAQATATVLRHGGDHVR